MVEASPERVWKLLEWFAPEYPPAPGPQISTYADIERLEKMLRHQMGEVYDSEGPVHADIRAARPLAGFGTTCAGHGRRPTPRLRPVRQGKSNQASRARKRVAED